MRYGHGVEDDQRAADWADLDDARWRLSAGTWQSGDGAEAPR